MSLTDRPTAVVLGGTSPHIVLIEQLRARGWRVVLVDYLAAPPAAPHADLHVQESTLDPDAVRRVAQAQGATLVIATCVDQANAIAIEVSAAMGLPHPYSPETAALIANKGGMKARMRDANLPTARHVFLRDDDDPADAVTDLTFPLVVKPADSNGSAGVRRVDDMDALREHLATALSISRVREAVVEEFVTGPELSIDCFVENGRAKIVLIRRKFQMQGVPTDKVIQSTGSIAPWPLPDTVQDSAEDVLSDLAAAFGLNNVPMLVQAFLTDDGLSLIEFSPRLSGGTGSTVTKLVSGFDAIAASIDSWLGTPVTVVLDPPGIWLMTNTMYAHPGTFDRIEGVEELLADGTIDRMLPYKTQGMAIGDDMSTRSRVGAFLVTAPDRATAFARTRNAIERLKVRDTTGAEILRREIFGQLTDPDA